MSSADLEKRAREKGISDALLMRIRAVYRPGEIEWLLGPDGLPLSRLEHDVDVRERTMNGPFRVREMNGRDGEAFAELWAHSPEKIGDWSVKVERSPNSLAQFVLHEDCSITVLEERGSLYACTAWSRRNVLLQGKMVPIHVAHSLRVHEGRRGERLADLVRRYPSRATYTNRRLRNSCMFALAMKVCWASSARWQMNFLQYRGGGRHDRSHTPFTTFLFW